MKVFIYPTGRLVEPFLDPVNRISILDEPLGRQRERILEELGADETSTVTAPVSIGSEPALLIFDHCHMTVRTLKDFVGHGESLAGQSAVLALPRGPVTDFAGPLQDRVVEEVDGHERVLFDAFVVRDLELDPEEEAAALRQRLLAVAERITLEPKVEVRHVRWPPIRGERQGIDLPCSLWGAAHLSHWVHLLWCNRQAIETHLLELAAAEAEEGRRSFLHAGREIERISKRGAPPVYVGDNCRIHPTVLLENVVLGDNVNLDLNSMVRSSVIGDKVNLGISSTILGCVIGANCHSLSDFCIIDSVTLQASTLSNVKLQNSVIGREAFITTAVIFHELGMDGDIQVDVDGQWVDSGRRILGGCVGHRCVLGVRSMFLGGRAVPNGYIVVMKPGEGLTKIPAGLPRHTSLYNESGTLRLLSDYSGPAFAVDGDEQSSKESP